MVPLFIYAALASHETEIASLLKAAIAAHDLTSLADALRRVYGASSPVQGKIDANLHSPNQGKQLEGVVATLLGPSVVDIDQPVHRMGTTTEVDIVTAMANIEVKSGTRLDFDQLQRLTGLGKPLVYYFPQATAQQQKLIESQGASVVRSVSQLESWLVRR